MQIVCVSFVMLLTSITLHHTSLFSSSFMCVTPKPRTFSYLGKNLDVPDLADNCDYVDWSTDHDLLLNSNKQFRIVQFNIRGIRSKYHELLDIINKLNDPEAIVLCETWLKPSDP